MTTSYKRQKATVNISAVRTEQIGDASFLVAPVTMLVEGVHHGNRGPAYYPVEEMAASAQRWNGVPVPINHPHTESGDYISANDPKILASQVVGRVYNTEWRDAEKKLCGEVWIEVDKANSVYPGLVNLVRHGGRLEVSTGFFSQDELVEGEWNGEAYTSVVRNIEPDHLAILKDDVGACSWEDGCGIRANIRSSARTPNFDGTETVSWGDVSKDMATYIRGYYKFHPDAQRPDDDVATVDAMPADMKSWIAAKSLLGDAQADEFADLLFFPVVNPLTDKLNEGALRAVISGRGAQADIPDAAKTSAQNKARRLLNEHFDAELETNATRTQPGGGMLRKAIDAILKAGIWLVGNEQSHDDIREALYNALAETVSGNQRVWIKEVYDDYVIYEVAEISEGFVTGAEKMYKRGYTVDSGTGMVSLSSDAMEVIEETRYVAVSATTNKGAKTESNKPDVKEDNMNREEIVKGLIANEATQYTEDDKEWLMTLDDCKLQKMTPKEPVQNKQPEPTVNRDEADEGKEPEKEVTLDKYIANAPAELRDSLRLMHKRSEAEKDSLVKALMANKRNKFSEEQLRDKSNEELSALAELGSVEVDHTLAAGGASMKGDEKQTVPSPPRIFLTENERKAQEAAAAGK